MFVVRGKPHAPCFSVVRRSIFDHGDLALRPESLLAKEMALVCTYTAHLVEGCHQRTACHFAALVDNNVQGHSKQPGQKNSPHCN